MQWVVTTGRTVEAAKDRALDALGIDETELDLEVLAEPSRSLFGLRTRDAKVRARVRPTRPRPKVDRRNRRQRSDGSRRRKSGDGRGNAEGAKPSGDEQSTTDDRGGRPKRRQANVRSQGGNRKAGDRASGDQAARGDKPDRQPSAEPQAPTPGAANTGTRPTETRRPSRSSGTRGAPSMSDITLDDQEPTALGFVNGLVDAFGYDADVSAERDDDETLEVRVEGEDLGLLVGQRGNTLASITELTRTAVAQQHSGRLEGRLRVDVAGYRARRKEALIRFAGQITEKVLDTGESVALEPMSPPDRKILHDAVNEIDGVHTESRGEDRRRHVVVHAD